MANEHIRVRTVDGIKNGVKEERGIGGKNGNFRPSVPNDYVRPKPVPVPQKSK